MAAAADQKGEWNLGELIEWICTRDYDRVARMWDMSEIDAVAAALLSPDRLPRWEISLAAAASYEESGPADLKQQVLETERSAAPAAMGGMAIQKAAPIETRLDRILLEVMRRVQTGSVGMRFIKVRCDEIEFERIAVLAADATDLELRVTGDERWPVILTSRTTEDIVGRSTWFSRRNAIRAWPRWAKKTAAAKGAILEHLRVISTPEHPLTKAEARDRCLVEVTGTYPEAFKRAWMDLERSRKRGRGEHGPMTHR